MVVVKIKRDEQGKIMTIPVNAESSEPPESPPPERPESPESPKLPSAVGFEFHELNRAVELIRFFDNAAIPFLKKRGVDDETIAELSTAFIIELTEAAIRKYLTTVATINLERAIEIIDEELPKLIKQTQSADLETVLNAWNTVKELISKAGAGGRNG